MVALKSRNLTLAKLMSPLEQKAIFFFLSSNFSFIYKHYLQNRNVTICE